MKAFLALTIEPKLPLELSGITATYGTIKLKSAKPKFLFDWQYGNIMYSC